MDQRDIEVLSGFDAVWARVLSGGEMQPVQPSRPVQLEEIMDRLHYAWSGYRQMSCRSGGSLRCRLKELAEDTKCAFRGLQLEYFLQTGEVYHPQKDEVFASCTLSNLRKLWKNAFELMQMLQAVRPDDGNLCTEIFRETETLVSCQKERLKCLIAGMMQ